jgi:hypothetical protein
MFTDEFNLNAFDIEENIIFQDPLVQGDTWNFQLWSAGYGSSGYAASITIAAGTTKLTAGASLVAGWYQWSLPPSATSQLAAQPYAYNVNVTGPGGDRMTIERGAITVAADISVPGTNVNNKTKLQLMLEACDATLIALMSSKTTMVQFAGQMYQMHDLQKLFDVRNNLAARVRDEAEMLEGNKRNTKIVTYFRNM